MDAPELSERSAQPDPDIDVVRYINTARELHGVDRAHLRELITRITGKPTPMVLLGYSDYAKHVVNVFGADGDVVAIADDDEAKHGWHFRSVPVVDLETAMTLRPAHFVVTAPLDRVRWLGWVTAHPSYEHVPVSYFPTGGSGESGDERFYDPWRHSPFYRGDSDAVGADDRLSMMGRQKILFLVETLNQTLHLHGDVLELGVWQGGSARWLARALEAHGLDKRLVLVDFFETLPRTNSEAIMCLDEVRHVFSFYPHTSIHQGDVDERPKPLRSATWCFVHYDAGFNARRLGRCFGRLEVGGVMVLDNYGHVAANPGRFDAWFAERGHAVAKVPHSEQGWVLKHAVATGDDEPDG